MMAFVHRVYGVPFAAPKVSLKCRIALTCVPVPTSKQSLLSPSLSNVVLMGQIMQRMMLTWLGEPGPIISTRNSFKVVLVIVVSYFVYSTALELATLPYDVQDVPTYLPALKMTGSILFSLWALYALCRTRESIRHRYSIEEERCQGCEDLCCSFWCSCCTVAQVARHTGDYEEYPASCCTQTGLPPGAPYGV